MTERNENHERLLDLIGGLMDGWIDEEEHKELAALLTQSASARKLYRQQMNLHARLHLDHAGGLAAELMRRKPAEKRVVRFPLVPVLAIAMVACIMLAVVLFWSGPAVSEDGFARIESTSAARWESTELPTKAGSRMGAGTFRLVEGLATVVFDSGAKVTLEAPAELTLIDKLHCRLDDGMVVADVPQSAIGFKISTPSVDVIDHGTSFSVAVDAVSRKTRTEVYQGLVELRHLNSGQSLKMGQGEFNAASLESIGAIMKVSDETSEMRQIGPPSRGDDWRRLTTTRDAYVGRAFMRGREVHRSDTLLLVKNGSVMRHAYLGFDLTDYGVEQILEAELALEFAPTGWGLASVVPDATFKIFGVMGDPDWDEDTLSRGRQLHLDHQRVVELGSFLVPHGVQKGRFGIEGPLLTEFLRDQAGRQVTLVVVRDTPESVGNGLIHGVASRRHPYLPGPMLSLRLSKLQP